MKRIVHHASQLVPALLALGLLAWVLRSADMGRALELVRGLGPWLPLLLLPNLLRSSRRRPAGGSRSTGSALARASAAWCPCA